jgi:RimJ/RimL family protein N-acetyltransferase
MIELKKAEIYQELELVVDDMKIGEAEIDIKNKMLSRLSIYEPYQNKGYGTEIVKRLTEEYELNNLWVNADNKRAIHVYEKNGYKISEPTMYLMKRSDKE